MCAPSSFSPSSFPLPSSLSRHSSPTSPTLFPLSPLSLPLLPLSPTPPFPHFPPFPPLPPLFPHFLPIPPFPHFPPLPPPLPTPPPTSPLSPTSPPSPLTPLPPLLPLPPPSPPPLSPTFPPPHPPAATEFRNRNRAEASSPPFLAFLSMPNFVHIQSCNIDMASGLGSLWVSFGVSFGDCLFSFISSLYLLLLSPFSIYLLPSPLFISLSFPFSSPFITFFPSLILSFLLLSLSSISTLFQGVFFSLSSPFPLSFFLPFLLPQYSRRLPIFTDCLFSFPFSSLTSPLSPFFLHPLSSASISSLMFFPGRLSSVFFFLSLPSPFILLLPSPLFFCQYEPHDSPYFYRLSSSVAVVGYMRFIPLSLVTYQENTAAPPQGTLVKKLGGGEGGTRNGLLRWVFFLLASVHM
ncbi:hypothetical protein C7M84_018285, partial [Penaeus vannamei]